MSYNAGEVYGKVGARFDDDGFNRWERRWSEVKRKAARPITQDLKSDVDTRGFDRYNRAARDADHHTTRLGASVGKTGMRFAAFAGGAAVAGGAAALYGLGRAAKFVYDETAETERVQAQISAAIKSTGGSAKHTTHAVPALADAISKKSGMDDEAIANGQALLLTFKNVRNEAGEGNKIFDRATQSAADLSAKGFGDLAGSSKMLGKALNDPIAGITALSRAGVTFSQDQKDAIAAMVESGDTLGAQKTILKEVESQVGGSAEAYGKTLPGAVDRARVALGNLGAWVGEKVSKPVAGAAGAVADFLDGLTKGGGQAPAFITGIGDAFKSTGHFIGGFIEENRDTLSSLGNTISRLGHDIGRLLGGIGDAFASVFGSGSGTGQDIKAIGRFLLQLEAVAYKIYEAFVRRALPGIITAFKGAAQIIRGVVRVIAGILTLDFGKAWDGVKDIFGGGVKLMLGLLRAATAPAREIASRIGGAIKSVLGGAWDAIKSGVRGAGSVVKAAFNGMRDAVRFVIGKIIDGIDFFLGGLEAMMRAASHLPFVGGKFEGVADAISGARDKLQGFKSALDDTPNHASKVDPVKDKFRDLITNISGARGQVAGFATDLSQFPTQPPWADWTAPPTGRRQRATGGTASHRPGDSALVTATQPTLLMVGEEAPAHPEDLYVFSRNPRDRPRMLELFTELAERLGVRGLRGGGGGKNKKPPAGPPMSIEDRIGAQRVEIARAENTPGLTDDITEHSELVPLLEEHLGAVNKALQGVPAAWAKSRTDKAYRTAASQHDSTAKHARHMQKKWGKKKGKKADKKAGHWRKIAERHEHQAAKARGRVGTRTGIVTHRRDLTELKESLLGQIGAEKDTVHDLQADAYEAAHPTDLNVWLTKGERSTLAALEGQEAAAVATATETDDVANAGQLRDFWQGVWNRLQRDGKAPTSVLSTVAGNLAGYRDAAKAPEKSTDPRDYLTAAERSTLGQIELAQADATSTAATTDDVAVAGRALKLWSGVYSRLRAKGGVPTGVLQSIAGEISSARSASTPDAADSGQSVAELAAAAVATFQGARADLFGSYGANFVRASTPLFATPGAQAAGFRYFGGDTGGTEGGTQEASGSKVLQQYNYFPVAPAEPHTFTQATLGEMEAALG